MLHRLWVIQKLGNIIGDDVLVGPDPWHGLRNSFRTWLAEIEAESEVIRPGRAPVSHPSVTMVVAFPAASPG